VEQSCDFDLRFWFQVVLMSEDGEYEVEIDLENDEYRAPNLSQREQEYANKGIRYGRAVGKLGLPAVVLGGGILAFVDGNDDAAEIAGITLAYLATRYLAGGLGAVSGAKIGKNVGTVADRYLEPDAEKKEESIEKELEP
jgi:hypothetical protein